MLLNYLNFLESQNVLLAPNGEISNLNSIQWHLVRTPEFINWFGDWLNNNKCSKVLDENGEPKVMYHGSSKNFTFFDINSEKNQRTNNFVGFYFTDDKDYAKSFSLNGYIYECFLNVRNPLGFNLEYKAKPSKKAINYIYNKYKGKYSDDYLKGKIDNLKYSWWVSFMTGEDCTEMAKIDGYDGYFDGSHDKCVFYPNHVKLATGENTKFDSNDDDIRN